MRWVGRGWRFVIYKPFTELVGSCDGWVAGGGRRSATTRQDNKTTIFRCRSTPNHAHGEKISRSGNPLTLISAHKSARALNPSKWRNRKNVVVVVVVVALLRPPAATHPSQDQTNSVNCFYITNRPPRPTHRKFRLVQSIAFILQTARRDPSIVRDDQFSQLLLYHESPAATHRV